MTFRHNTGDVDYEANDDRREYTRTVPAGPSIVPIHSNRLASDFGKADWWTNAQ
jgi:hypothetical protein